MKQVISILVAVLYMLGTLQVSLAFHHCGGNFKYISLHKPVEKESCCKKVEEKSCCHKCCTDKEVTYKVDDQQHSKVEFTATKVTDDLQAMLSYQPESAHITYPVFKVYKVSHSPPLTGETRQYILNCTFLI